MKQNWFKELKEVRNLEPGQTTVTSTIRIPENLYDKELESENRVLRKKIYILTIMFCGVASALAGSWGYLIWLRLFH